MAVLGRAVHSGTTLLIRRLRGCGSGGYDVHGLTPTAKCGRGFAALPKTTTLRPGEDLCKQFPGRQLGVSKKPRMRRPHGAVGVSRAQVIRIRMLPSPEPRRRRLLSINCKSLIAIDLLRIIRLRFPHYIPLFEKESTGPSRTLADVTVRSGRGERRVVGSCGGEDRLAHQRRRQCPSGRRRA